ncbi:MAG TPA: DOPA 4,5-dioxygenase family protein [Gemmatimonadaceae bacterium]|jgi:DOPA 4,5-dioxygenase
MAEFDIALIRGWHAHVYFDADTRDRAWAFREQLVSRFGAAIEMGRFHERPVGPHPQWSYQIAFAPERFAEVIGWVALNHGALDLLVHPNTGDELRDHRDRAIWIGRAYRLDLNALGA